MSNSRYNRKCILCGTTYKYCSTCREYADQPVWKNVYCCENCRTIFNTLVEYKSDAISKEDAANILKSCDLTKKDSFRTDLRVIVEEILAEESTEQPKPEVKVETKTTEKQDEKDTKKSNEEVPFHRRKMSKR